MKLFPPTYTYVDHTIESLDEEAQQIAAQLESTSSSNRDIINLFSSGTGARAQRKTRTQPKREFPAL